MRLPGVTYNRSTNNFKIRQIISYNKNDKAHDSIITVNIDSRFECSWFTSRNPEKVTTEEKPFRTLYGVKRVLNSLLNPSKRRLCSGVNRDILNRYDRWGGNTKWPSKENYQCMEVSDSHAFSRGCNFFVLGKEVSCKDCNLINAYVHKKAKARDSLTSEQLANRVAPDSNFSHKWMTQKEMGSKIVNNSKERRNVYNKLKKLEEKQEKISVELSKAKEVLAFFEVTRKNIDVLYTILSKDTADQVKDFFIDHIDSILRDADGTSTGKLLF